MIAALSLCSGLALAAPTSTEVLEALRAFNEVADFPAPKLDTSQVETLIEGEIFKSLERSTKDDGAYTVVGVMLSRTPRSVLWLSCQDPHSSSADELYEQRIELRPDGSATWFGYVDLPFPFTDRAYVVDVWDNHTAATALEGRAWEHAWRLRENGEELVGAQAEHANLGTLTRDALERVIFFPESRGAWGMIEIDPEWTLLTYQSTASLGGGIPDRLVGEFVLVGIEKLLRRHEARTEGTIQQHYVEGHAPVLNGEGDPIPSF